MHKYGPNTDDISLLNILDEYLVSNEEKNMYNWRIFLYDFKCWTGQGKMKFNIHTHIFEKKYFQLLMETLWKTNGVSNVQGKKTVHMAF